MTSSYDRLWTEINPCVACRYDHRIAAGIRERWQSDTFLPYQGVGPEPAGLPVRYLLVAMEPSARPKRNKTRAYMEKRIADGARNFRGDHHIRWAAHHWLVNPGEAFLITDLAKCMVPTKDAGTTAPRRYANCWPWLSREIDLFKGTLRAVIPLGDQPHQWCLAFAQKSWPTITEPVVHPAMRFTSWKAAEANYDAVPTDEEFAAFVKWCDPEGTPRLDKRKRGLLARWNVQFAEMRASLAATP